MVFTVDFATLLLGQHKSLARWRTELAVPDDVQSRLGSCQMTYRAGYPDEAGLPDELQSRLHLMTYRAGGDRARWRTELACQAKLALPDELQSRLGSPDDVQSWLRSGEAEPDPCDPLGLAR